MAQILCKILFFFLVKSNRVPYDTIAPLLGIYPNEKKKTNKPNKQTPSPNNPVVMKACLRMFLLA